MKKETIIVPSVFGLIGILLGLWTVWLVGQGWQTGGTPLQMQMLRVIGPISFAPLLGLESLGLDIHRGNFAFMAAITFISWAALGALFLNIWRWVSRMMKHK